MKRAQLAERLARQTGLTRSDARNEVDKLVQKILEKLRQGESVKLPGVGKLKTGK
jgi:nucleoid DNA-binding protein